MQVTTIQIHLNNTAVNRVWNEGDEMQFVYACEVMKTNEDNDSAATIALLERLFRRVNDEMVTIRHLRVGDVIFVDSQAWSIGHTSFHTINLSTDTADLSDVMRSRGNFNNKRE